LAVLCISTVATSAQTKSSVDKRRRWHFSLVVGRQRRQVDGFRR